jgi:hypothetical protein
MTLNFKTFLRSSCTSIGYIRANLDAFHYEILTIVWKCSKEPVTGKVILGFLPLHDHFVARTPAAIGRGKSVAGSADGQTKPSWPIHFDTIESALAAHTL